MARVDRFEDLEVWKTARKLALRVFQLSNVGAFGQDFVLRNQIRKAADSVSANIAEGFERDGAGEFRQFLSISKGSAGETRSHVYLAVDRHYLAQKDADELQELCLTCSRQIANLMKYLRGKPPSGIKYKPTTPCQTGA